MRDRLGPWRFLLCSPSSQPADLRSDLAGPILDALRWAYPFRLGGLTQAPGEFVDIETVDHQVGQTWRLVSDGESWGFDGAEPTVQVASMSLSANQAWRLLTNNYDPLVHGALRTTGDPAIVETLMRTRAIIGTPK